MRRDERGGEGVAGCELRVALLSEDFSPVSGKPFTGLGRSHWIAVLIEHAEGEM